MERFEYIKWFWKNNNGKDPIVLFYEVDTENERYATRMTEVYVDRKVHPVIEDGFEFVTEAPVPTTAEINADAEFHAVNITKEEFEAVYVSDRYDGNISFQVKDQR